MVSLTLKRGLETIEEADYRRAVRPRFDADLGEPVDVRELAPPTDAGDPLPAPQPKRRTRSDAIRFHALLKKACTSSSLCASGT